MRLRFLAIAAVLLCSAQAQAQTVTNCSAITDPDGFMVVLAKVVGATSPSLSGTLITHGPAPVVMPVGLFEAPAGSRMYVWHLKLRDPVVMAQLKLASAVELMVGTRRSSCGRSAYAIGPELLRAPLTPEDIPCPDCVAQLVCEVMPTGYDYPAPMPLCAGGGYSSNVWAASNVFFAQNVGGVQTLPSGNLLECIVMREFGHSDGAILVKADHPITTSDLKLRLTSAGPVQEVSHQVFLIQGQSIPEMYYQSWHRGTSSAVVGSMFSYWDDASLTVDQVYTAQCHYTYYTPAQPTIGMNPLSNAGPGFYGGCPNCLERFMCSTMVVEYGEPSGPSTCPSFNPGATTHQNGLSFTDYDLAYQVETRVDFLSHIPN